MFADLSVVIVGAQGTDGDTRSGRSVFDEFATGLMLLVVFVLVERKTFHSFRYLLIHLLGVASAGIDLVTIWKS